MLRFYDLYFRPSELEKNDTKTKDDGKWFFFVIPTQFFLSFFSFNGESFANNEGKKAVLMAKIWYFSDLTRQ